MSERIADEREESAEEGSNTLAWFLTGALIGATVALLYAPRSGKDTRRYITDKTQESKDAVTETSKDILDAGRDMFERGRRLVEDAADLFERGRTLVKGNAHGRG
ncbi:MAG TPA: YtxH domain-containing protein [Bryobacteraceae bacterium]|jgi:gas vesicle protein|nr:YtxH domain-containing protein [Bryobacteraceae bacterium]